MGLEPSRATSGFTGLASDVLSSRWNIVFLILGLASVIGVIQSLRSSVNERNHFAEISESQVKLIHVSLAIGEYAESTQQANAPVNDIFISKDIALEAKRLSLAEEGIEKSSDEILKIYSEHYGEREAAQKLKEIFRLRDKVLLSSRRVLNEFNVNKIAQSAVYMGEADQVFAEFLGEVRNLKKKIESDLISNLGEQKENLDSSKRVDELRSILIGLVLVFMLVQAILIYLRAKKQDEQNKEIFNKMSQLNSKLNVAQSVAKLGTWEFDLKKFDLIWSSEHYRIFEIQEPVPSDELYKSYRSKIHPEDLIKLDKILETAAKEKQGFMYDHRVVLPNNRLKYVQGAGQPLLSDSGELIGFSGTCLDVTDARRAQKDLEESIELQNFFKDLDYATYHSESYATILQSVLTILSSRYRFFAAEFWKPDADGFTREFSSGLEDSQAKGKTEKSVEQIASQYPKEQVIKLELKVNERLFGVLIIYRKPGAEAPVKREEKLAGLEAFAERLSQKLMRLELEKRVQLKSQKLTALGNALDASTIVAETDRFGVITQVNDNFCKITGYSREELIGKTHQIINSGFHPSAFFQDLWKTIAAKKTWSGVIKNRAKDGSEYYVHSVISPLLDEEGKIDRFISIRFDVTAQRLTENRLEEAQRVARIGSWEFDLATKKITWSKQMFELFPEKIENGPPEFERHYSTIHPDDRDHWSKTVNQCVQDGKPYVMRFRVVFDANSIEWIEAHGEGVFDRGGKILALRGTCQNITSMVKAESEIALERSKALHSAKLASLGEMSAGVAHEINNPLSIIVGNLALLPKSKDDPEKFSAKIATMLKSTDRIAKIVSGLRRFSRYSGEADHQPFKLSEVIVEATTLTDAKVKQHHVQFSLELESAQEIRGDALELEQVLINLISNGIDAVKGTANPWVKVKVFDEANSIVLQVIDSGNGIAPEVEQKLFQPFFTTKGVGQGTGLGLSIVKGILDQHQASITLNRQFPNTCFEVRFKAAA